MVGQKEFLLYQKFQIGLHTPMIRRYGHTAERRVEPRLIYLCFSKFTISVNKILGI